MEGSFVTWSLLGLIAAIDLATFAALLEHRGRIAKVEAEVCDA